MESHVSVRMIILLGIFVWAPLMGYLAWKYIQTFSTAQRSRSRKRRAKQTLALAGENPLLHREERRRVRRTF